MNEIYERFGVFPALMQPAHKAAERLLREGLESCPIEGKYDFYVTFKGHVANEAVYHEFEIEGQRFVIYENQTHN